jgi:hypothetical protein
LSSQIPSIFAYDPLTMLEASSQSAVRPVIFVHVPKAGGSSMLRQFEAGFGPALLQDYDRPPLSREGGAPGEPLPAGTRAVIGHFHAARYDRVAHAFRATILRHPVDNLISIFFFWRTLAPARNVPAHLRFLAESPSFEAFARYPEFRTLMSVAYFGGYDMDRFDFIGFHETRSDDIPLLAKAIGIPLDPAVHVNRTHADAREVAALRSDAPLMRRVKKSLADDVIFYEKAVARRSPSRTRTFVP